MITNITKNIEDSNTSIVSNVREEKYDYLRNLPENQSLYKCPNCRYIFDINRTGMANILIILSGKYIAFCPICGMNNSECMCKVDAHSVYLKLYGIKCRNGEIISGTKICPICEKPICPQCFNHSVVSLSRITGYMSDISGWNVGKKQELLDRQRYNIMN